MCAPHPSPAGTAIISAGGNPTDPMAVQHPPCLETVKAWPRAGAGALAPSGSSCASKVCACFQNNPWSLHLRSGLTFHFLCAKLANLQGSRARASKTVCKGQERVRTRDWHL